LHEIRRFVGSLGSPLSFDAYGILQIRIFLLNEGLPPGARVGSEAGISMRFHSIKLLRERLRELVAELMGIIGRNVAQGRRNTHRRNVPLARSRTNGELVGVL